MILRTAAAFPRPSGPYARSIEADSTNIMTCFARVLRGSEVGSVTGYEMPGCHAWPGGRSAMTTVAGGPRGCVLEAGWYPEAT